jgi:hypothetical protein
MTPEELNARAQKEAPGEEILWFCGFYDAVKELHKAKSLGYNTKEMLDG